MLIDLSILAKNIDTDYLASMRLSTRLQVV